MKKAPLFERVTARTEREGGDDFSRERHWTSNLLESPMFSNAFPDSFEIAADDRETEIVVDRGTMVWQTLFRRGRF